MQNTTKTRKIFKDISILIFGNIVTNQLSLRQRAVNNFQDTSDTAWDMPDVNSRTVLAIPGWLATLRVARKALWGGPRSNFHWKNKLTLQLFRREFLREFLLRLLILVARKGFLKDKCGPRVKKFEHHWSRPSKML